MNLNHQYPFRIAHLTDLHVAATWQPVLEAAALVAAGIPVMGSAVLALRETVQSLPPEAHLPIKLALGAVGLVGGAWMASQSRKARSMAKCVLAMLYQYNHSGTHRRRKLFRSLRENRVDHLMITGDLTVTSHPAEYCKVCEELALYGFDRDNMTVLPGNHDRVRFPLSARFEDFFSEVRFPDVREIVPGIIVTAVDSNVPDADWTLWDTITANTRGFIDPGQIRSLARKLDGVTDETVIAGVHHLPARRRSARLIPEPLKRTYMDEPEHAADFRELCKKHQAMVLCGHDHPRHSRIIRFDGLSFCQGKASGLRFQQETAYDVYDVLPGRETRRLSIAV